MKNNLSELIEIGYGALVKRYQLSVIPHYRTSYITQMGRGSTCIKRGQETIIYPKSYSLSDPMDPIEQLAFAIKHEGINLEIISECFLYIPADSILNYVKRKPTGKYCRIIWFLFELLMDAKLALDDLKSVPYIDLMDASKYYVGTAQKSKRHAVNNNLLGNKKYCPTVRRTALLNEFENKHLSDSAKKIMNAVDPAILARAANYLYTKETKSSFGIEKVKPDVKRAAKFIALLESASSIPHLDKALLLMLQNNIVEDPYKDKDYRITQNYVGELTNMYMNKVHYISPKPEDLPSLMLDFLSCETRLFTSNVHPVIVAAILSFGFVFLHPFEDGNGRIHRFIIHYVLSKTAYTPDNIIFPVSAVMLKNIRKYDEVLESYSKPLLAAIGNYDLNDEGELHVSHKTKQHYQYVDYTHFAEYLFSCIELTIQEDFQEELDFLVKYDKTKLAIEKIIDMPTIKLDRIIRCIAQNNGVLGEKMRQTVFQELSDTEINDIEKAVQKNMLK